ncbi:response regulator transcription factor [Paenibacillus solani]|uniref:AraC family transcriptional regulator n=1 Tax=Paenibacillus solani TaxID=1705565 RepID=A0A0M1P0D4_9BACL|nr:response regulator [Paenibacillus solani]KOR87958.1 AraC family transcriptional regulator [Paenibacillus solani]
MYRLMMIDDEYAIHFSLRKLVERSGLQVEVTGEAEDGVEALQLLEGSRPDIIVTDICMPEMDGLEFIRRVRESHSQMHFIILSGHDNFEFARQAIRYGVSDFLLKPIDPDQFHMTLEQACRDLDNRRAKFSRQTEWTLVQQHHKARLAELLWSANEPEALEQTREIMTLFETRGPAEVSVSRYARMLIQDLLAALEERGLPLAVKIGEDEWLLKDDPADCGRQVEDKIKELLTLIKGSRNLGSHHNIQKAKRYIEENYDMEDLSLQEVADSVGMSVTYLSRTFKNETNMNFVKYLVQVRMEKAKELLAESELSAQETAYRVGFSDYVHFSKTFKKYHGLTPSAYRKQCKAMNGG